MLPPNSASTVTPTPRRVPEPYIRAEIAAFPLASEISFHKPLIELDPTLGLREELDPERSDQNRTRLLWRECEKRFAPHTGWSLDRLVSARDLSWFGSLENNPGLTLGRIPMHQYLRSLARSHLIPRAGVTEIKETTDLAALDAAIHYRWLTLTLPEDLLLAALGVDPAPVEVEIEPPLLVRRLLDMGVAEIHQHVGAGMDFPLLWVSALAAIATPDVKENELVSGQAPFADGRYMVLWLLAAAVARCALAEHLIRGGNNFGNFLNEFLTPWNSGNARSERAPRNLAWTPRRRETLAAVLRALKAGDHKLLPEIEPLRDLYADIHPTALTLRDDPVKGVFDAFQRCDPVAARLGLRGENVGERWFLRCALAYLDKGAEDGRKVPEDEYFARIFWQTVRIRCQYYRTVVQRPLTGGLQWFLRFYDRLGKLRNPIDPISPQVSYHVAGERHRIRGLELRTHPGDSAIQTGERVLEFLKSWRQVLRDTSGSTFEPEMGVVFHFVKERDIELTRRKGVPPAFWADTHAEPFKTGNGRTDVEHGRYVGYFAEQCRKARALGELIRAVPSCLWIIRGLDVCTDEIGVPTWVLVPLFRHVLDEAAKVSILTARDAGPPLKVTAHVGEDFRHLLEGLRRIYEQVHYILGGAVGRLGHAIALGVDPKIWAESVGSVLMPAEERLWDLVWEWRLYSKYKIKPEYAAQAPPGRVDALLNQVRQLSDFVFGRRGYRVDELAEVHDVLHRFLVPPYVKEPVAEGRFDTFLEAATSLKTLRFKTQSFQQQQIHPPHRIGRILEDYFDDESIFQRGQTLIDVPISGDEVAALTAVQSALRHGIAQRGIVVEVNPSSNLMIGDLLDLRNHPILRLFPPVPEPDGPPPVPIAIGSDDPLTFGTRLLREYTLLHQAACAAGYPERVTHEWLESIRSTGMDARFTRGWRPSTLKKADDLIRDLSEYLHLPCKQDSIRFDEYLMTVLSKFRQSTDC
ncbi:hypothetical protein [Methylocaldum sp. 14B]|uniref:hypothetical protein n=1 Tax=Methylocaldum sp. 14B TaxID=1912213 RepID=UPI0011813BFB|nr:hypothetical protein [Methylocaldum sp. 14B]